MTGNPTKRQAELPTFVARFWLESTREGAMQWRGRVKHVQGRQERYFHDLVELQTFMEQVSGASAPVIPGPKTSLP